MIVREVHEDATEVLVSREEEQLLYDVCSFVNVDHGRNCRTNRDTAPSTHSSRSRSSACNPEHAAVYGFASEPFDALRLVRSRAMKERIRSVTTLAALMRVSDSPRASHQVSRPPAGERVRRRLTRAGGSSSHANVAVSTTSVRSTVIILSMEYIDEDLVDDAAPDGRLPHNKALEKRATELCVGRGGEGDGGRAGASGWCRFFVFLHGQAGSRPTIQTPADCCSIAMTPFGQLVRRLRYGKAIVIVSGLPRSGTSMAMKMLEAGGIPILADGIRPPTSAIQRVLRVRAGQRAGQGRRRAWLAEARGKAVKIISFLLTWLPETYDYRVIFMQRDLREVLASQNAMLAHRGEAPGAGRRRARCCECTKIICRKWRDSWQTGPAFPR